MGALDLRSQPERLGPSSPLGTPRVTRDHPAGLGIGFQNGFSSPGPMSAKALAGVANLRTM